MLLLLHQQVLLQATPIVVRAQRVGDDGCRLLLVY
jgi:hypothetical protein